MTDNLNVLQRAFAALNTGDMAAFHNCLHDDAVLQLPFVSGDQPIGRSDFEAALGTLVEAVESLNLTTMTVYELAAPDTLVVEYASDAVGRTTPVSYRNKYIGVFTFKDETIIRWREFDNRLVSSKVLPQLGVGGPARS